MATVQGFSSRSPATILSLLRRLPGVLSGRISDANQSNLRRRFVAHFVQSLMTEIHAAFLIKSEGGTDSTGSSWRPLSRETIAGRRISVADRRRFGIGPKVGRGLLTKAQDRRWRGIFASAMTRLEAEGFAPEQARAMAGQLAWAILKSQGARTRLDTLGRRRVPILIDRGRLERSLRPGSISGAFYRKPREQIVDDRGRTIVVGSAVPYAARQHRRRRLYPTVARMRNWISQAVSAGATAVARQLLRNVA